MQLNITIPVYNEERRLEKGIGKLLHSLEWCAGLKHEIVIADNASTDRTPEIASTLASQNSRIRVVRLERKGRGGALRRVWTESDARVCSYMDVDMSSDLSTFPSLVKLVTEGTCDVATGSRLLPASRTNRGWKREVLSRGYNALLRPTLGVRFSDAQCGFKAVSRRVVEQILPAVENNHWFFDTELLVLGERAGLIVAELPLKWQDNGDSRVSIFATIIEDLKGIVRLRRRLEAGIPTLKSMHHSLATTTPTE